MFTFRNNVGSGGIKTSTSASISVNKGYEGMWDTQSGIKECTATDLLERPSFKCIKPFFLPDCNPLLSHLPHQVHMASIRLHPYVLGSIAAHFGSM
jgi:hypothetical protein